MSTIHINLNDTIVLCGENIEKLVKVGPVYVNEAATNASDFAIVEEISGTVVSVVFICVVGYVLLKLIEHTFAAINECNKRKQSKEEILLKQKATLVDMKLKKEESAATIQSFINQIDSVLGIKKEEKKPSKY